MKNITYDELDNLYDKMEKLNEQYPSTPYFPTPAEIEEIKKDPDKYYEFLIYLTANNPHPVNPEDIESDRAMNAIIKTNTEYVE